MFDIKNSKVCPICESKMIMADNPPDIACVNGCCEILVSDFNFGIVGVTLCFEDEDNDHYFFSLPEEEDELIKRIKYWRKDYRYLAEILERN